MDGGLRRTETGRRVSPCRRLEFGGERSAKHRFPRGAAGIAKGVAVDPLCPFTDADVTYCAKHKVNGTLRLTDQHYSIALAFFLLAFRRQHRHPVDGRFTALYQPLVSLHKVVAAKKAAMGRKR